LSVSVEPPAGAASVRIGTYSDDVGSRSGSFVQFEGETEQKNASALAAAFDEEPNERAKPAAAIEEFQETADAVTGRIEKTESLLQAAARGQLLKLDNLTGEINSALDLLGQLDRAGRFEEELRLMRSLNGLLALALRWLDLIRSLRSLLRSAETAGDAAGQAFAHHELGTLYLCAGQPEQAREHLRKASRLQQRLSDLSGHCATRHNLDSAERDLALKSTSGVHPLQRLAILGGVIVVAAGAGAGIALAVHSRHAHQPTTSTSASQQVQSIKVTTPAPPNARYRSTFTVAATGGASNEPIVYSSSGACTNTGAAFTMTGASGTCKVMYDQAGNGNYKSAPRVTETVNAAKAVQSITVTKRAPASAEYGQRFTVAASDAGSGKPLVYSSSGACTNNGASFTMISASGTCKVMYDLAGNGKYKAAPEVTETVQAVKAGQKITVTVHAPTPAVFNSKFTVAASGGRSGQPIVYSSSGGGCTNSGSNFSVSSTTASGTCTVTYEQAGNANYKAAPKVDEMVDVVAAFGGFRVPAPNATVPLGSTLRVTLTLADASGKPLPSSVATPLAATGVMEVVLTGPNGNSAQLASAPCTASKAQFFFCTLTLPPGLQTGTNNQYILTAFQKVGGGRLVQTPPYKGAPAADVNPETILFG
jgi:tetratricopeptide (TPR) repeat protein